MIDSHCHLADEKFAADLSDVVGRAVAAGVLRAMIVLSAGDAQESAAAARVRALWPGIRVSVGVHPHAAGAFAGRPEQAAAVVTKAVEDESASAVGEIGLDYHYDFAPRDVQQAVFAAQIAAAQDRRLPIVIHTREATEDTFDLLRAHGRGDVRGVFHCFTGDVAMAGRALDLGFHISLGGIVTFPRSSEMREVAAYVPADRLLIETDAPYLAPVPYRGKRNEPSFVGKVLAQVAALRGVQPEVLAAQLVANFDLLLGPTVSHDKA
jgi:TatD DNase family protein